MGENGIYHVTKFNHEHNHHLKDNKQQQKKKIMIFLGDIHLPIGAINAKDIVTKTLQISDKLFLVSEA